MGCNDELLIGSEWAFQCLVVSSLQFGLFPGLAERNALPADFKKDMLQKYIPVMQQYGMREASDYLEQWVLGTLPLQPLLDVSAFHGHDFSVSHFFNPDPPANK